MSTCDAKRCPQVRIGGGWRGRGPSQYRNGFWLIATANLMNLCPDDAMDGNCLWMGWQILELLAKSKMGQVGSHSLNYPHISNAFVLRNSWAHYWQPHGGTRGLRNVHNTFPAMIETQSAVRTSLHSITAKSIAIAPGGGQWGGGAGEGSEDTFARTGAKTLRIRLVLRPGDKRNLQAPALACRINLRLIICVAWLLPGPYCSMGASCWCGGVVG